MRAGWVSCTIAGVGFLVFALLAWHISDNDSQVWQMDRELATRAKNHAGTNEDILEAAVTVTDYGGIPVMVSLAVVGSLLLLMCGQTKLAAFWVLSAALGAALNQGTKTLIDRPRPGEELRDQSVSERNPSYPSGHAMGSTIGYGVLGYAGLVLLRRRWPKLVLVAALTALVIAICWSRVYLRAHWCSDVIGGSAIGLGWLSLCIAVLEASRSQKIAPGKPTF